MSKKTLIRVGSTSEHKLGAVRDACEALGIDAEVVGVAVISDVDEQPDGVLFTTCGALARVNNIDRRDHRIGGETPFDGKGDLLFGIENGIVRMPNKRVIDHGVVFMKTRSGKEYVATSAGLEVSGEDTAHAEYRGFGKHTVASVTAERTGCDPKDATPYYTGGRVTRRELLAQAAKVVLAQWLTDEERRKANSC